jgi:hypothetical protein
VVEIFKNLEPEGFTHAFLFPFRTPKEIYRQNNELLRHANERRVTVHSNRGNAHCNHRLGLPYAPACTVLVCTPYLVPEFFHNDSIGDHSGLWPGHPVDVLGQPTFFTTAPTLA